MDELLEIIRHADDALLTLVTENANKAYSVLFLLIALETTIIFFPFIPGDILLFSSGVIASSTVLDLKFLIATLIAAATIGNFLNYYIGRFFGARIRRSNNYFIKNHFLEHLPKAERFYEKYGGNAIIISRFFPIMRAFIPFLAGLVKMTYFQFIKNTIIGAILWVVLFVLGGFYLGEIEWIRNNYGLVSILFVLILVASLLITIFRRLFLKKK